MVKDLFLPTQLSALDFIETVIVALIVPVVLFLAIKGRILPVPLAASPMEVLLFVQLNEVPVTAPEKLIKPVDDPLQSV